MDAKRIGLGTRSLGPGTFERVSRLKALEEVVVRGPVEGFVLTRANVEHLKSLPALKELWISDVRIEGAALAAIGELHGLDTLTISDDGNSLENLHGLKQLRILRVYGLKEDSMHKLGGFPQLRELGLTSGLSDGGVSALSGLRELEAFSVEDQCSLTDAGLQKLRDLPRLRRVQLNDCRLTGSGFAGLKWPAIERIYLTGNPVSDSLASGLEGFPSLKGVLILKSPPQLTDKYLCRIARTLHALEDLKGGLGPEVTDRGIECLKGHASLREIWLTDTSVTPAAAQILRSIPTLREVKFPAGWPMPEVEALYWELQARRSRDLKEQKKK